MSYLDIVKVGPKKLGLNGVTLQAERTSNSIGVEGVDDVTVGLDIVYSGSTRVDVNVDGKMGSSGWMPIQSTSTDSAGASTLSDLEQQKTVGASLNFSFSLSNRFDTIRIRVSSGAGSPTASDTATVRLGLARRKRR